jgi:hypothetical protein
MEGDGQESAHLWRGYAHLHRKERKYTPYRTITVPLRLTLIDFVGGAAHPGARNPSTVQPKDDA